MKLLICVGISLSFLCGCAGKRDAGNPGPIVDTGGGTAQKATNESAVGVKKEIEEVKVAEKTPPVKPVNMPPTVQKVGKVTGMGVDELFVLQQGGANPLIYDVRAPYIYQIDHIESSVNWPDNAYDLQVQRRDQEIEKALSEGRKVVVYCYNLGCAGARNVAAKLKRRGYEIHVLTMGIDSWRNAGLPLVNASGESVQ